MDILNKLKQDYTKLTPKNHTCGQDCDFWRVSSCMKYAVCLDAKFFLFVRDDALDDIKDYIVPPRATDKDLLDLRREGRFLFLEEMSKVMVKEYIKRLFGAGDEKTRSFLKSSFILGAEYSVFSFFKEFTDIKNDCLKFGECMVSRDFNIFGRAKCFLQEKNTGRVFGESDEKNIVIADTLNQNQNLYDVNENANPDVGECYAIIRRGIEKSISNKVVEDYMPYHISFVFAKDILSFDRADKNIHICTNITIEANAGDLLTRPIFYMYDVVNAGARTFKKTAAEKEMFEDLHNMDFHNAYNNYFEKVAIEDNNVKKDYKHNDCVTSVLQKRTICKSTASTTRKRARSPTPTPTPAPAPAPVVPIKMARLYPANDSPVSESDIEVFMPNDNSLELNFFTNFTNMFSGFFRRGGGRRRITRRRRRTSAAQT